MRRVLGGYGLYGADVGPIRNLTRRAAAGEKRIEQTQRPMSQG
jgi:hypothetical protein